MMPCMLVQKLTLLTTLAGVVALRQRVVGIGALVAAPPAAGGAEAGALVVRIGRTAAGAAHAALLVGPRSGLARVRAEVPGLGAGAAGDEAVRPRAIDAAGSAPRGRVHGLAAGGLRAVPADAGRRTCR